jgi:hypothetical protein
MTESDRQRARTKLPLRGRVLVIPPAILLFAAFVHGRAVGSWWLGDDPQILLHAIRYSPWEVLFRPEAWRTLSTSNFTPLVTLSFQLDLLLTGLRPSLFYVHQMAVVGLAAAGLWMTLRRYTLESAAVLAAISFLLLSPTFLVVNSLMLRHYAEGLLLSLGALLAWQYGSASRRTVAFDVAGGLLYLLAILAKEVYAPLPLLLAAEGLVGGCSLRKLFLRLAPYAAGVAVYAPWRISMLGSTGGYGGEFDGGAIAALPLAVARGLAPAGLWWSSFAALAAGATLLVAGAAKRPVAGAGVGAALFVAAFLPIAPVAGSFELRYAFAAGVVAVSAMALAARSRGGVLLFGVLALSWAFAAPAVSRSLASTNARSLAEGQYVWNEESGASALLADSPAWYVEGLGELKAWAGEGTIPRVVYSRHALDARSILPDDVAVAAADGHGIVPLPQEVRIATEAQQARYEPHGRIAVRFERRGDVVEWSAGPAGGVFTFLTYPGYDDHQIESSGRRRVPHTTRREYFRLRRDDPSGSWTLTPPLPVPASGQHVEWSRP